MATDDDLQTKAIADEWGVDPQLLEEVQFEIESNETNDGMIVSYFIRFSNDTDRELLDQLGVAPGEFYRELSVNAFDEPDGPEDEDVSSAFSTYSSTGSNFDNANFSNFRFAAPSARDGGQAGSVQALKLRMLEQLDLLESLIRLQPTFSPNRGHNNPPELIDEPARLYKEKIAEVQSAVADIRQEANAESPDADVVIQKASVLRHFSLWLAKESSRGVVGGLAFAAFAYGAQNWKGLANAAIWAADAALAWVQQLTPLF